MAAVKDPSRGSCEAQGVLHVGSICYDGQALSDYRLNAPKSNRGKEMHLLVKVVEIKSHCSVYKVGDSPALIQNWRVVRLF
jgi:hypothetical protein